MRRRWIGLGLAAATTALLAVLPARAQDLLPTASQSALKAFHRHYSSAVYPYPRHAAAPLGVTGWEVAGSVGWVGDFDDGDYYDEVVDDDLALNALAPVSLRARKGIPWHIDLGVSWTRDLDLGLDLWSGEVQWAFFEGGPATPALALRVTGGQGEGDVYRLTQAGAEVLISKGFTVLTPFAGAGVIYGDGSFDFPGGARASFETTTSMVYLGATLNLLLPKITATVEKGEDLMWVVQLGFGF